MSRLHLENFYRVSRALFRDLIEPIAVDIAESSRVVVLPDGHLHRLSFPALLRPTAHGDQYLIEWKPIHVALSATVYAELTARGSAGSSTPSSPLTPRTLEFVAFGDPDYSSKGADQEAVVRSVTERIGFDWRRLPHTRREVEAIAKLFPDEAKRVFLGQDAREERVKSLERQVQILHLAAHGYLDEQLPSSSFIALSSSNGETTPDGGPPTDNGLLQVWEIFETVRIDASLVVLSACESGLGEELDGEGVIGLTRAFQYAGARSVVASLWNVADQATAELMLHFYRHMQAGLPKDAALRAAQLQLIRAPIDIAAADGTLVHYDASSPYYWAAFQLYGDWR